LSCASPFTTEASPDHLSIEARSAALSSLLGASDGLADDGDDVRNVSAPTSEVAVACAAIRCSIIFSRGLSDLIGLRGLAFPGSAEEMADIRGCGCLGNSGAA